MFVLSMQRYISLQSLAINGYELLCILHHKKKEMLLSRISIAAQKIRIDIWYFHGKAVTLYLIWN